MDLEPKNNRNFTSEIGLNLREHDNSGLEVGSAPQADPPIFFPDPFYPPGGVNICYRKKISDH